MALRPLIGDSFIDGDAVFTVNCLLIFVGCGEDVDSGMNLLGLWPMRDPAYVGISGSEDLLSRVLTLQPGRRLDERISARLGMTSST